MKNNILILLLLFIASISYGQRAFSGGGGSIDYISNVLVGTDTLYFTGIGKAFNSFVVIPGGSLWTEDSNGINYQAGNVGINRASLSSFALSVDGTVFVSSTGQDQLVRAQSSYSGASAHVVGLFSNTLSSTSWGVEGNGGAYGGHFQAINSTTAVGVYGRVLTTATENSKGVEGFNPSTSTDAHYGGFFQSTAGSQSYGVYAEGNTAAFRVSFDTAPSSATDTGTAGEMRITTTHIYVCTATDVWVRAALTTW